MTKKWHAVPKPISFKIIFVLKLEILSILATVIATF